MELGINAGLQFFSSLAVAWCGMRYYKVGPPTSYKWSYNPYKWPYKWVIGVISPRNKWSYFTLLNLLITGGGGPPTLYSLEAKGISCSLRFPIFPPSHATWRISHPIICMILWPKKSPPSQKVPNKVPTCGKHKGFVFDTSDKKFWLPTGQPCCMKNKLKGPFKFRQCTRAQNPISA